MENNLNKEKINEIFGIKSAGKDNKEKEQLINELSVVKNYGEYIDTDTAKSLVD